MLIDCGVGGDVGVGVNVTLGTTVGTGESVGVGVGVLKQATNANVARTKNRRLRSWLNMVVSGDFSMSLFVNRWDVLVEAGRS